MSATQTFDVVVLGSGPGGYRAAVLAAARGLSVAIIDRDRIAVGGTLLSAAQYIVATDSRPVIPDSLRKSPGVLTTDDLFERALPAGRRVALVGGGAVGTEMAFILSMLGFDVQWYCRREPLQAMRYCKVAKRRLVESLGSFGIAPRPLERAPEGADWLLAGTGRAPNTDDLGLEAAGGELLGCEIVGTQAGELIHLAQQGPPGEPIAARLARARFNHPSRAEGFGLAGESLLARRGLPQAAE